MTFELLDNENLNNWWINNSRINNMAENLGFPPVNVLGKPYCRHHCNGVCVSVHACVCCLQNQRNRYNICSTSPSTSPQAFSETQLVLLSIRLLLQLFTQTAEWSIDCFKHTNIQWKQAEIITFLAMKEKSALAGEWGREVIQHTSGVIKTETKTRINNSSEVTLTLCSCPTGVWSTSNLNHVWVCDYFKRVLMWAVGVVLRKPQQPPDPPTPVLCQQDILSECILGNIICRPE